MNRDLLPKISMPKAPVFILVKVAKTWTPLECTQTKEIHLKIVKFKDKDRIKTETQAPSLQLGGSWATKMHKVLNNNRAVTISLKQDSQDQGLDKDKTLSAHLSIQM